MYVIGASGAGGKRAGPSIYELNARAEGRSPREIPRLVMAGLAITWHAGRRELITMAALELLSGIGVAAELVVGRRVLAAVLAAAPTTTVHLTTVPPAAGLASVWVSAAIFGAITALLGLAGVVLREQQRMLSELTPRYAQDRILDVTCAAGLAAFDDHEFHDRVARAQAGVMRAPQMVCWHWSLAGWPPAAGDARSIISGPS
jgi:ATP-binding cassette, subfamily B, bacterial